MSRAALMAASDPFVTLFAFNLFKRWQGEVDKLYICYNRGGLKDWLESKVFQPNVEFIYVDHPIGNGEPINRMLNVCKEELVLLLEDDGFIYKKGVVDKCFKKIKSGECDAVGSPRGSCGLGLSAALCKKYNVVMEGYGDHGPNFWPNFFFCKKADLLKTDQFFASKNFPAGQYVKEADYTPEVEEYGDTFVWTCMQLRHMGLRFCDVPQVKAFPYDLDQSETRKQTGEWDWGWIHAGSLSSGWLGLLRGQRSDTSHLGAILDLETRAAFFKIIINSIDTSEVRPEADSYKDGIDNLINLHQLNRGRVNAKVKLYKEVMSHEA